nr:chromatin assembly factor 1 subunit A-B-like isoform X2 [Leptinotarsa decemlineata]XP_023021738.1 chromatin assembly factor 1 subunit A-B-like isoform X2 [Leptinotarsa decemlineata]
MPNSRKRQHSRSRSKSKSRSRDRSDCDYKRKKYDDVKTESQNSNLSVTSSGNSADTKEKDHIEDVGNICRDATDTRLNENQVITDDHEKNNKDDIITESDSERCNGNVVAGVEDVCMEELPEEKTDECLESTDRDIVVVLDESDDKLNTSKQLENTPKKGSGSKKKLESEKKRLEREKEKEERERKRNEEKERILQEKLKRKEEKQREYEQKQREKEIKEEKKKKEREEKEEQKKKEREEREQKRKEKEEKDEQKRKEREQEKIKKQQEIDEKNKEKIKEEEKKQKAAAAFVNFFVPKKSDSPLEEKKYHSAAFMAFEIKSDMKLPSPRRNSLTEEEKNNLDSHLENQNCEETYLKELKRGKTIGRSFKTWPYEEPVEDDVTIVEVGETICEDKSTLLKVRAKFFKFRENRRPAYYGTWRKKSKVITSRKPFTEDKEILNYEEDSDDDWEEEEQGESLNGSEDEAEKDNDEEKDDYEVDNDFFVPHGHLSDDEIDDEEKARLSPESLKQKLKLLKEEFDQDMKSKTNKLKPRSIGCIWYNKDGSNVDEALDKYLQSLAIISNGPIVIKKRSEISTAPKYSKVKMSKELNPEHIPVFLKIAHGNTNKKIVLVEQFLSHMEKTGLTVDISKATLIKKLKQFAKWRKGDENGPMKNKFGWFVHKEYKLKYDVDLV